ncbi:MAG: glucose 1-dehydrogenase [Ignavibacteria bacterium]|nr:glucose 1-dehydrogenase [Ignavibacteria bacterium]
MSQSFPGAFSLEGENALITGGATGIGYGIAKAYSAAGAKVILAGRREDELKRAVSELGERSDYRVHDVTAFSQSASLINSIEDQHGSLTILVNNAGIHLKKPAVEVTEEEFLQVLNVHVLGAFSLSRNVATNMMRNEKGSILFIASMASLFGIPYVTAYSAAKSAYLGMVRALATEWSPKGIRINAIAPGWIETEMMRKAIESDPERKRKILGRTPMNKFGSVEDIGWAATYLSSPAAQFITGTCLSVDGGVSIGF